MKCIFVQIRCTPGKVYDVADAIAQREIHSELYSTSGEWDLLMKIYVADPDEAPRIIGENIHGIDGIVQTLTTMTFKTI